MSNASTKPVIFISYSHKDEPERTAEGDIHWLSELQSYLWPSAKGKYELWTDEHIAGGGDWEGDIKAKLAACDICILLLSRHSLRSSFVIDVEIETIRERQQNGDGVVIYPIVLTPFPQSAAPPSLLTLNLRPRLDKPLSGFSRHERGVEISKIADEIVAILRKKSGSTQLQPARPKQPVYVHITSLPDTAYERLVGREVELNRLDEAWADHGTNMVSLVAEGGGGKSALVNEWLKDLQADNYRDAEAVLGWSFYNQGSEERTTSADPFLDWALDKLGLKIETTSASAKGEAIAEAMTNRRILLVLDGVEPMQYGSGPQFGQLKDVGLRALLRRFAAEPPADAHGFIVITSRLAIKDIARWKNSAAPVIDVEKLSDEAGAQLLRDNGVWGTDTDLKAASHDFGGHPLALDLLASFLETQFGDVRRRDHIREFFAAPENPRLDHAKRVMESLEKEWLADQPVLVVIMRIVGLFDRPASRDCLHALRKSPVIKGLTEQIVKLDVDNWQRSVLRLREVRLLAPSDLSAPEALDAHPLVREWFGKRFKEENLEAWRAAHSVIYDHLRRTAREGTWPTLQSLEPLYQAIAHGCSAGRHPEVLREVYQKRICRFVGETKAFHYSQGALGAYSSDLAAISYFFIRPYDVPVETLTSHEQMFVFHQAGGCLKALGRFAEALPAQRTSMQISEANKDWSNAARAAGSLAYSEMIVGNIDAGLALNMRALKHADRSGDKEALAALMADRSTALHAAGRCEEAKRQLKDAEKLASEIWPESNNIWPESNYTCHFHFYDLLLAEENYALVRELANCNLEWGARTKLSEVYKTLVSRDLLALGRAHFGMALLDIDRQNQCDEVRTAEARLNDAVDSSRLIGQVETIPAGVLARAAFRRTCGDWHGAKNDLDEIEEGAELGPMRLFLCDSMLERARVCFARIAAFAPLNGMLENNPPKPVRPDANETVRLTEEARANLDKARKLIIDCGYHRRDVELGELDAILSGSRCFADSPPRV